MVFRYSFFIVLILNTLAVLSQECRYYGQSCFDDFACCGGCCSYGKCKDTYLDCRKNSIEDPCTNRHCPDGQVCFTYQPRGCKGCGLLIECRSLPLPKELEKNKTHTHYHLVNSSESLKLSLSYLNIAFSIIVILIIL